jgi:hypothetical protein
VASDEKNTRRGLLRWGARLAIGAPALLAGLQIAGATAHADDDDDDRRGRDRGRGRDNGVVGDVGRGNTTFSADLVPVNMTSGDFSVTPGDTGSGTLDVFSNGAAGTGSINVRLQGATANTAYTLVFETIGGSRSGSLGTLTTNAAGNASASFSGVLAESGSAMSSGLGTRVGVFVVTKSGGDAFVTAA